MNIVLLFNIIGNQLLCHDDELEGRRIAYILYLVPEDWNQEDGGKYDLNRIIDTTMHIIIRFGITYANNFSDQIWI